MKNLSYLKAPVAFLFMLAWVLFHSVPLYAGNSSIASPQTQNPESRTLTGRVVDENGQPMVGVAVVISGTSKGTVTDVNGNFDLKVLPQETTLRFSFIGYETQLVAVEKLQPVLKMQPELKSLDQVVVIGYGTQTKKDLTGSISNVKSSDFNDGLVSSPEQLINGKVSGVQIISNGGSPSSGSTIRIRGGASLNASNNPLIVLDGVPLENGGISGNSDNFLSLINPSDIASMTILKDASSTAIYGSRASNGVILITTKKGGSKFKINFSSTQSVQNRLSTASVLSPTQFRSVIEANGTDAQTALLGSQSTNWNDQIFHMALGTDNTISFSGSVKKKVPFRLSMGYFNQNGILKTDNVKRYTSNLSLSPRLFNNSLKVNLNIKTALNRNRFAYTDAIYAASSFNPTIPVFSGNDNLGGYNEALGTDGTPTISGEVLNPLGLLNQYRSTSKVNRIIGNYDMDYKVPFLPQLKAHLTLGYDYAKGKGTIGIPKNVALDYASGGRNYQYGPQKNTNKLLTFYLDYAKDLNFLQSRVDVTAGYDYQKWKSTQSAYNELNVDGESQSTTAASDERHVLLSYYGRLNYSIDSKYLLTATVRRDGSSRFNEDDRWGMFPSVALAWNMNQEKFLSGVKALSNLKLRLSYGVTGQQDGIGNYGYISTYTPSQAGAYYLFGNTYQQTYRPEAYVYDLQWEKTKSYNTGLDYGFFNERLSGSIDYYNRKTTNLLATVPAAAGTNFNKTITTNVGSMKSDGLEIAVSGIPVQTKDWKWSVSYNFSWEKVRITNLALTKKEQSTYTYVGQAFDDYYLQIMKAGYAPYTFYTYKQVYDKNGKPIEGQYADLNGDGKIDSNDLYEGKSPNPKFLMNLSSSLSYNKWTMSFSLRASIGNYAYNGTAMNMGALGTVSYNSFQLNNLSTSYLKTGFTSRQYLSDYYIENASFLKMDNITLGYNFGDVLPNCHLNLSGMVQNVFTITGYSGVDPEINQGIESSFYPRARVYSLSLGLNF